MTETKHTPGPWKVDSLGVVVSTDVERLESIATTPVVFIGNLLFGKYKASGEIDDFLTSWRDRAQANGKLIAAAPDLLKSLEFLTDAAGTEPGMAIYREHIKQARAAIAKAKGQKNEKENEQ